MATASGDQFMIHTHTYREDLHLFALSETLNLKCQRSSFPLSVRTRMQKEMGCRVEGSIVVC